MGISFGSIGTGLPKDIVKQIMKAERAPVEKMKVRKEKTNVKKQLLEDLTNRIKDLKNLATQNLTARDLRELKVVTNSDFIDVIIDKNNVKPGIYQFQVGQLAQKSSAMSSGVEDQEDTYLGVGFIRYVLPNGEQRDVYVDQNHSSLKGIANVINNEPEMGMSATVVNDGSGEDDSWRLILSLKDTGSQNLAEFPYFYFVDGEEDFFLEFERPAHNAKMKLDGFEIEKDNNSIKDLIPGATIDLKKASPGEEFSIKISEDKEKITTKIEGLVETINAVLLFIKEQNTLDESSDTSKTLGGDNLLQSIEMRLRGLIFKNVKTLNGQKRIGDIGIRFQREGLLEFNSGIFDSFLAKNYNTLAEILTGAVDENNVRHNGFINNLNEVANLILRTPNGLLPLRKNTFQSKIDQIDRRIESKERILEQKEKNLKNKFARLESTISKIKNQGAGLAGLAQSGGFNPVQQLG